MLTISDVARKYNISNRQVQDLVDYGYLKVTHIARTKQHGFNYLFSEHQLDNLDIYSHLAEIRELKSLHNNRVSKRTSDFKKILRAVTNYDNFLEHVSTYPEQDLLKTCYYLYHLNHYAKTYPELSQKLYHLKNQVLKKIYSKDYVFLKITYLSGPDRKKVWLCEDCKDAARTAGLTYTSYIKKELYCPKCDITAIDKEFYSLVEFRINIDEYKFTFHLPRSSAVKWLRDLDSLPQENRKTGKYDDRMYLYGRLVTRVEEKVFPLAMIIKQLTEYVNS